MKYNKVLILSAAAVLVVGFLLFSLEKLQVTNLYEKPVTTTSSDTSRPVNDVDYTPHTSPPDPTTNSEKNQSSENTNTSNVSVTITRANQDTAGSLNVGVLINGISAGTCELELLLANSEAGVLKEAAVITDNGTVSCAGFNIPASEIPGMGSYTLKISVGGASASQNLELKK